ncbi:MAG: SRPBCC family protein [Phycisphaerales bacterium]|nr:SRPBCC family protein [Phycisphaerales bacterium]
MAGFEITRTVNAPIDRVFDVFTDLDHMWPRIEDIVKIERDTSGPVGVGTVYQETRAGFGRESTSSLEFTEFDPPNRWAITAASVGIRMTTSFDLQPEEDGTRLIVNTKIRPLNPVSWFMGLFLSPLLMGTVKRAVNRDLDTLCQLADGTWVEKPAEPEETGNPDE